MRGGLRAYTLVELGVVLVIMVTILCVVLYSSTQTFSRRSGGEARLVVSDIILARNMAASKGNNYCIRFGNSTSSQSYDIYNGSSCSGTPVKSVELVSFINSPNATVPFNIIVYNATCSTEGIGGTFGFPSVSGGGGGGGGGGPGGGSTSISEMVINFTAVTSVKTIRLFNSTGYVRMD